MALNYDWDRLMSGLRYSVLAIFLFSWANPGLVMSEELPSKNLDNRCAVGLGYLADQLLTRDDVLAAELVRGFFGWMLLNGAVEPKKEDYNVNGLLYCDRFRDQLPILVARLYGDFKSPIDEKFFLCSAYIVSNIIILEEKYGNVAYDLVYTISFKFGKRFGKYVSLYSYLNLIELDPIHGMESYNLRLHDLIADKLASGSLEALQLEGKLHCQDLRMDANFLEVIEN